jgi:hypothetical protein
MLTGEKTASQFSGAKIEIEISMAISRRVENSDMQLANFWKLGVDMFLRTAGRTQSSQSISSICLFYH